MQLSSVLENVSNLDCPDYATKLKAIRNIKNAIIGNNSKKKSYTEAGAVQKLSIILNVDGDEEMLVQTLTALNSFACGPEHPCCQSVVDAASIPTLTQLLFHPSAKVVETCMRTISTIFHSPLAPDDFVLQDKTLHRVIELLASNNDKIVQVCASFLSYCCRNTKQQDTIAGGGAIPVLLSLVSDQSLSGSAHDAVLEAIISLSHGNPILSTQVAAAPYFYNQVMSKLFDPKPKSRLVACRCLVAMSCTRTPLPNMCNMKLTTLHAVIKLLSLGDGGEIGEGAAKALCDLVGDDDKMHKAAIEAGAVKMISMLLNSHDDPSPTLIANSLNALASLSSVREDGRKAISDAQLVPVVIESLAHKQSSVRLAACRCSRSLSRSVKSLRSALVDEGLALPLLSLLGDAQTAAEATGAVCNLVLEFSPVKKMIVENDGVEALVELIHSMDENARLNALWAIKNLLYDAPLNLKMHTMQRLTFPLLLSLSNEADTAVREQSYNIMRNLAHGSIQHVQYMLEGIGGDELVQTLVSGLSKGSSLSVQLQAVYCAVNIATGYHEHKMLILNDELLTLLLEECMRDSSALQNGALWVFINLTYDDTANEVIVDYLPSTAQSNSTDLLHRAKILEKYQLGEKLGSLVGYDTESQRLIKTLMVQFERALALEG